MTAILRATQELSIVSLIVVFGCLAGAGAQEEASVRGEIVDLPCYMTKGGRGVEYQACARLGAQLQGVPIGLVTDSGELLLLVNQSADRDPYEAAKRLTGARALLTGRAVTKHGMASLIVESAGR